VHEGHIAVAFQWPQPIWAGEKQHTARGEQLRDCFDVRVGVSHMLDDVQPRDYIESWRFVDQRRCILSEDSDRRPVGPQLGEPCFFGVELDSDELGCSRSAQRKKETRHTAPRV
jgi:hypothetical protein